MKYTITQNKFMNNNTIICLHGYGKRRGVQFKLLEERLGSEYNFVCPNYFTLEPDDINYKDWLDRAEAELIKHQGEDIILIGFSLGAVLASYFANKYNVKKLIFLGASFEYEKFLEVKNANPDPVVPAKYLDTFVDVVDNCASSIKDVKCPVVFIHAKKDQIIPYELSVKYYEYCKNPKSKLILLEGGQHMLFDDEGLRDKTIEILSEELKNTD